MSERVVTGGAPVERRHRRRTAVRVGLGVLVVAALTATGVGALQPSEGSPGPPSAVPPFPPVPQSGPQHAAIVVSAPVPARSVPGSDGDHHVEYDLVVTNTATTSATLTVVEVPTLDGRSLLRLDGAALAAATQPLDSSSPTEEVPGSSAVAVVVDLQVPAGGPVEPVTHRVGYELGGGPAGPVPDQVTGPDVAVDPRAPVMVTPPLSGPGWLTANSCCDASTGHRAGRTPTGDGGFVKTETFAVDWLQLDGDQPFSGDGSLPEQWHGHGAEVVAAAGGTVVAARDGLPEQPPGSLPTGIAPDETTGNEVVVQIEPDTWAVYAHLAPGSVAVAVGDEVVAGQALGRLGGSGNSLGPHLHFGLMDGPDPRTGSSVPFVLDEYTVVSAVEPASYLAAFTGTGSLELLTGTTPVAQAGTLPLNLAVIDF